MSTSALADRIDHIKTRARIKSRDIAQLLGTTPQTVSRWQTGKSSPQQEVLERLLTLDWIVEQLSRLYEPEEARIWLFSHHALLEGDRPADRIEEGRLEDVLALVDQLETGAHV